MAAPTIRELPPTPSVSDPATFPARASAFLGALAGFRSDLMALAEDLYSISFESGPVSIDENDLVVEGRVRAAGINLPGGGSALAGSIDAESYLDINASGGAGIRIGRKTGSVSQMVFMQPGTTTARVTIDGDAGTVSAVTLDGALNASNLTGTIPNARLSGDYSFANLTLSGVLHGTGNSIAIRTAGSVDRLVISGDGIAVMSGSSRNARFGNNSANIDVPLTVSGGITVAGITAAGGGFTVNSSGGHVSAGNITSATGNVGGSGGLNLRPQGGGSATNQTTIANNGNMTVNGSVSASSFSGSVNASNLTGTIADARISSNIARTSQVPSAAVGVLVGLGGASPGTVALCRNESGSSIATGGEVSGASLRHADTGGNFGSVPAGTWRAMSITGNNSVGLFRRIA